MKKYQLHTENVPKEIEIVLRNGERRKFYFEGDSYMDEERLLIEYKTTINKT